MKYEEVCLKAYETVAEALRGMGNYFDLYNGERPLNPQQAVEKVPAGGCLKSSRYKAGAIPQDSGMGRVTQRDDAPAGRGPGRARVKIPRNEAYFLYVE